MILWLKLAKLQRHVQLPTQIKAYKMWIFLRMAWLLWLVCGQFVAEDGLVAAAKILATRDSNAELCLVDAMVQLKWYGAINCISLGSCPQTEAKDSKGVKILLMSQLQYGFGSLSDKAYVPALGLRT